MTEQTYRVDAKTIIGDWPVFAVLIADVAFGVWALPRLPEQVPVHWNILGEADRWGSSTAQVFRMPAVALGVYLLILFLPLIDPRRKNYALFPGALRISRWAAPILVAAIQASTLAGVLGYPVRMNAVISLLMGLMFVVLGNVMPRMRHNYFVGIRVPWTLSNEENWRRTHRMAGPFWVGAGLAIMVSAFLPDVWKAVLVTVALAVAIVVPIGYSYWVYVSQNRG